MKQNTMVIEPQNPRSSQSYQSCILRHFAYMGILIALTSGVKMVLHNSIFNFFEYIMNSLRQYSNKKYRDYKILKNIH